MSVRNGEPYLSQTLESILHQTYGDFVFLILDNASTDNTRSIIQSYNDSRIHLVALPRDIGQTAALNRGVQMAETPWIGRIDADDVALPHRFQAQMEYLTSHPETALLGTWWEIMDAEGNHLSNVTRPTRYRDIMESIAYQNPFAHPSVVFRREAVLKVGGFPKSFVYAQDRILWMMLSIHYPVANLPEISVRIRYHTNQATNLPELSISRKRERIQVLSFALSRMSLSPFARRMCRAKIAKAMLDYATTLSENGRYRDSFRQWTRFCVHYPDQWLWRVSRWKILVRIFWINLKGDRDTSVIT